MSVRIGSLSHRLTLEALQRIEDGAGGTAHDWVEIGKLWARIRPLSGDEKVRAERLSGSITHDIQLRYRDDLKPSMRLRNGTRSFHILAVLHDERERFTTCKCEERDL